jgi:hypothetical protein
MNNIEFQRSTEDFSPAPPATAGAAALTVVQWIAATAGIIAALKTILQINQLDEQLDEALARLHEVKLELMRATADILEAIDGVYRQFVPVHGRREHQPRQGRPVQRPRDLRRQAGGDGPVIPSRRRAGTKV